MPRHSHGRAGPRPDLGPTYYRSAWEANWARYLHLLTERGHVTRWDYEPVTLSLAGGRRPRHYTPDFRVVWAAREARRASEMWHAGEPWGVGDRGPEFHEVKGFMDERSRRVLAAVAERYPRLRLVVIDRATYERVERAVAHQIPAWEYGR